MREGSDWIAPTASSRASALALAGGHDDRSLPLDDGTEPAAERYVPLYEAKMIHQFDHRWATYDGEDSRDVTEAEKRDPGLRADPTLLGS